MVRVGLVGYGFSGTTFHAPLFEAAGMKLVAVASSRHEKIKADWPDATAHATPQDLFADPEVDLAVIAAPSTEHCRLVIEALEAGKHVVTDKPFCFTVEEADQMIAARDKAGKLLTCFQNRRWDTEFLTLRKLLDEDRLGKITSFRGHFEFYFPFDPTDETALRLTVPIHFELGPHQVDQVYALFGMPEWVYGDLVTQRPGAPAADRMNAVMGYADGLRVELVASFFAPDHSTRYAVHGTKGSYVKRFMDPQEAQLIDGMKAGDVGFGVEPDSHSGRLTEVGADGVLTDAILTSVPGDFSAFYRAVGAAIEDGAPLPLTGEDARNVIRIVQAIETSSDTGQRITFA